MGKSSAPEPDPNIGKASLAQAELGKEWLQWEKTQYADNKPMMDKIVASQVRQQEVANDAQEQATARSDEQWKSYNETSKPMEELSALNALGAQNMTDSQVMELADSQGMDESTKSKVLANLNAQRTASEDAAAKAKAGVISSAGEQQAAQQRNMASMGLNPNSGRYQGADKVAATQTALSAAGAENSARNNTRQQSAAMVADQANFGRGGTQVAAQQAGLGLNSGAAGVNAGNSAASNTLNADSGIGQGFQGAMQGNNAMISGLSGLHQSAVSANSAENASKGQMAGAAVTLAVAF